MKRIIFDVSTGSVTEQELTQTEIDEVLAQPQPTGPKPLEQIAALEREQLMPRATREFMLMFMESSAPPEVLAVNYGYQAVKAFDNRIKDLRALAP